MFRLGADLTCHRVNAALTALVRSWLFLSVCGLINRAKLLFASAANCKRRPAIEGTLYGLPTTILRSGFWRPSSIAQRISVSFLL